MAEIAKTLNQFVLLTVPFELLICLPPAALLFGVDHPALLLHPGTAAVKLICGQAQSPALCLGILTAWCIPAVLLCIRTVGRHFLDAGGVEI
ncbi:MAG: hypothetical protein EOM58_12270 [Clostridia bacterium]|nr:hypothetical protein [Clostridia bacterium]